MKRLSFIVIALLSLVCSAAEEKALYVQLRYPGSTVDSMADRILSTVEYTVRSTVGVSATKTTIRPDRMFITATLRPNCLSTRIVHLDLEHRLQALRPELPSGVTEILVSDPNEYEYPVICCVSGKGTSMHELKLRAMALRDDLLRLPEIADAYMFGEEEESVFISIPKDEFLLNCGLNDLGKMLSGTLNVDDAGALNIGSRRVFIRSPAETHSADDMLDMPYTILSTKDDKTTTVMLRDHVTVSLERSFDPPDTMTGIDGERCVLLALAFAPDTDGGNFKAELEKAKSLAPLGVKFDLVHDLRAMNKTPPCTFELRSREGSSIEATDASAREFAALIAKIPGVSRVLTVTGGTDINLKPSTTPRPYTSNRAILIVDPKPNTPAAEINRQVAKAAAEHPCGLFIWPENTDASGIGIPIHKDITDDDPKVIERKIAEMTEKALAMPGITLTVNDWGERVESIRYILNDSRARQLGLTYKDVSRACRLAIEGMSIASCWDRGDRLPVILRVDKKDMSGPQDLETMWVHSSLVKQCVPFSQVVSGFESISEPGCRHRENGHYVAHLLAYAADAAAAEKLNKAWSETPAKVDQKTTR